MSGIIETLKPDLWMAERDLVAPEYHEAWDGLVAGYLTEKPKVHDWSGHDLGYASGAALPDSVITEYGRALDFNGSSHVIQLKDSSALELQDMSIAMRIKPETLPTWFTTYMLFSRCDTIGSGGYEFALRTDGTDSGIVFAYRDSGIKGWYSSTRTLLAGVEYDVGMKWSPSLGAVTFYVDGEPEAPISTASSDITHVPDTPRIGYSPDENHYDGIVEYLYVHNRVKPDAYFRSLRRDPFGLLTQAPPVMAVPVGLAPDAFVTVLIKPSSMAA